MLQFHVQSDWLIQILVSLFLAILFLQSSIDKIVDRAGNMEWLVSHFSKSPLASTVRPMFFVITILEFSAGVLSAVGCLLVILGKTTLVAFCGATVAATALTALFFGQRVAKDYEGAAALVPYFLLAIAAMWLLGATSTPVVM